MQGKFGTGAPPWRRRRVLALSVVSLFLIVGVLLGLVVPSQDNTIELGGASLFPDRQSDDAPIVVASEYHETYTTLWLLDARDPSAQQQRLVNIPHAPGWDIESAAANDQRAIAVLAIPPDGWDPQSDAALMRVDQSGVTQLASGLNLRGGVRWSDDDERLIVHNGGQLAVLDADDGRQLGSWATDRAAVVVESIAMRGDSLWVAMVGADGTSVLRLQLAGGELVELQRVHVSETSTRDWSLSPDGAALAFSEQRGAELSVRVVQLADQSENHRVSAEWSASIPSSPIASPSASPVWRPDGELDYGVWSPSGGEFSLPLSWHADGEWLAMRLLQGDGPGAVESEQLALQGADGSVVRAPDGLRFVGWWAA